LRPWVLTVIYWSKVLSRAGVHDARGQDELLHIEIILAAQL
jgi:hypothetical protein